MLNIDPLNQVKLRTIMEKSKGARNIVIGIIDGPIDFAHSAFQYTDIQTVRPSQLLRCKDADSIACTHGTFVAGILCADRSSKAPSICPGCKIIARPIFKEESQGNYNRILPATTLKELANAIIETVDAGARVINMSLGLSTSSFTKFGELDEACEYAYRHGAILISASGNQNQIGSVQLLCNKWIIPVAACDNYGKISGRSNYGSSIGYRGLMAPGINITSTYPNEKYAQMTGSSIAAPFVSGTTALLWSLFPNASPAQIMYSLIKGVNSKRHSVIPPLLNAELAKSLLDKALRI